MEIEGVKIFQCCSSISFANMNNFKNYLLREVNAIFFQLVEVSKIYYLCNKTIFLFQMDMKAVPLDQSEMRDLISDSWSDSSLERKDFECSCVCDQPLPPPRVSFKSTFI